METFDYVIVGGGTAAGIVAYRLGEKGHTVCVLEAGPPDDKYFMRIPAGFMKTIYDPSITFQINYEPSPHTNNRIIPTTQGRTLGGGSSVNGMIYSRGQAADFDHWAQFGNRGWGYADILKYFRRTEHREGDGDPAYRGFEGGLHTSTPPWDAPALDGFIKAAVAAGHRLNPDYNGAFQEGVGRFQSSIYRGQRQSTAVAYLHPARKKFQVDVRTNAPVLRLVFEGRTATGAVYQQDGAERQVKARREVILCAGAVHSPKLLQLSGVGPSSLLGRHGISVLQDVPGVGENFRDHYNSRFIARAKAGVDTVNTRVQGLPLLREITNWMLGRPNALSISPALAHVFARSDPSMDNPDYALFFMLASFKPGVIGRLENFPGMTLQAWQMRPESRGYVRIRSASPQELPAINPNYLAAQIDRDVLVKSLKAGRAILTAPEFAPYFDHEVFPGKSVQTDDEWYAFIRENGNSSYHLIGTCKMGPATDTMAVVDDRLRVHKLNRLRVIDSSIMPTMPSSNTNAPTMMIAEKGVDMILEDAARDRAAA